MERVKRRWWTWAITLLAAVVIVGAVISGLFQLAVLTLPSYRADLSAWVTHVANRPVQIGGVNLGWHGIEPRLDLTDITLFSEDGDESLTMDRLSLGFSPFRLITGDMLPERLEVSGLTLDIARDDDGRWRFAGFAAGDGEMSQQKLDALQKQIAGFGHVVVQNCTLAFRGKVFGPQGQELRIVRLDLEQAAHGFELDGRAQLPVTHGDVIELSADIDGPIVDPRQWSGDFEFDFERLRPQGWLAPFLQQGVQIAAENLNGTVEGHVRNGQVRDAQLQVDSESVVVARDGHASGAKKMQLQANLGNDARGWIAELKALRFDDELLARGDLRWTRNAAGQEIDVNADELHLGRLMPWLVVWRDTPAATAQLARLSGTVRNLVLRLYREADGDTRYSTTARLDDIAFAPDAHVGVSHISGEASANENGGQLRLKQAPVELQLPAAVGTPLALDGFDGQIQWQRGGDGWRIGSPAFSWTWASTRGDGRFDLLLPAENGASPVLDLNANFAVQDINQLKPFMLLHWSDHLRDWLEHSLKRAHASRGTLTIRGPLDDFPFIKHPDGVWKLDADIGGADLAFADGWPPLTDVAAHLSLDRGTLAVDASSADINGNKLDRAVARIDDLDSGLLHVDAATSGGIGRFYDFLRASPLHETLAGLLDETRAAGHADVAVKLDLPLHDLEATTVDGSVALDNVQMFYDKLDHPLSGITGTVHFSRHGAWGDGVKGRFEDLPLSVRIEPRDGTHGVVIADFPFTPNVDGVGASQFLPAFIREAMRGGSAWHAELPIAEHGGTALTLSSELRGTAILLPEPLAKPADMPLPISVRIGGDAAAPLRIGVGYGQRLGADMVLGGDGGAHDGLELQGLRVRFGGAAAPKAQKDDFIVDGHAGTLDVAAWIGLIGAFDEPPAAGTPAAPPAGGTLADRHAMPLDLIDLDADHLRWQQQFSDATHLRWTPSPNGWRATLGGRGVQGTVEWNGPGAGRIVARLDHLALTPVETPDAVKDAEQAVAAAKADGNPSSLPAAPPSSPAQWPELDLICDSLTGKDADLGRVEFRSVRIADGQRLDHLKIAGGALALDAAGQWRRRAGKSSAELQATIDSDDFEAVLRALDYEQNFRASKTHIKADLKWMPSATGLMWQQAAGRVDLSAEDGQLRAVKPGAGRVLGLLNFYALPRRLLLNFSDVVDEGLGFDNIDGHFDLGNGAALTSDLTIKGPSVKIDMRGRIGLVARDYDERVTVYPAGGLSSGVTLGAALLGGPAVGALVLLAQEVLDKPLDSVTQLTYHVFGSWDNPQVERVDSHAAKPEARKK